MSITIQAQRAAFGVLPIIALTVGYQEVPMAQARANGGVKNITPAEAAFMADSQVPWGLDALNGAVTQPAWKTKPSWSLVAKDDKMIPPDAQRAMFKRAGATVVEVKGSHAVYASQPRAVADIIAKAAHGVALATQ